jgi:hypothetical protein
MLLAHLKGKSHKKQMILETQIKMGESTRPPLMVGANKQGKKRG